MGKVGSTSVNTVFKWTRDHLEYFVDRLHGFVRHLIVLRGGMTAKARHRSVNQLASIPDTTERLVLATGRYVGEGFDDA
jgi:hypothetical protein